MKKWLAIVGLLVVVFASGKVEASEVSDLQKVIDQYALSGDELTQFETQEKRAALKRSVPNEHKLQEQYNQFVEDGIFGKDVTFEMYAELASIPEPNDPVTPSMRSVAGQPQPGDIMITNGTSLGGLTGHAGIFLGDGSILSIAGGGHNPKPMYIMEWAQKYMNDKGEWTKIYRPASKYRPALAEQWAINNYRGKKYSYGITTNIFSKDPTYCSKIVWQAYWYASAAPQVGGMKQPLIVSPYDLPNYFNTKATHIGTWSA